MVPDTLDAQVVTGVQRMRQSSQRFDEEALSHVVLALQYENPRVDAQSKQTVFLGQLQFLAAFHTVTHKFTIHNNSLCFEASYMLLYPLYASWPNIFLHKSTC